MVQNLRILILCTFVLIAATHGWKTSLTNLHFVFTTVLDLFPISLYRRNKTMAHFNRTSGWKYRKFILKVLRQLDLEKKKLFGFGSRFTHSVRDLYDRIVQEMDGILTWSDLNEASATNPRDTVYKFRIRTTLQDLKRDGLVETQGRKQGWRRTNYGEV